MSEHKRMEVMCRVNNCRFHENNYCQASKLEVNPKHGHGASSSQEALCSTFVPHQ